VLIIGVAIQPILARLASGSMQTGMSKQAVLVETLNGLDTIQATGSGRLMKNRFEVATTDQSELGLKARIFSQFAINSQPQFNKSLRSQRSFTGCFDPSTRADHGRAHRGCDPRRTGSGTTWSGRIGAVAGQLRTSSFPLN